MPWLLGTNRLPRIAKTFVAQCPKYVERMHEQYPLLTNVVSVENAVARRWLAHLGFRFHEPAFRFGRHGELYQRFYRDIRNV